MNIDKKKFLSQVPLFMPALLEELISRGFIPTLVGGSVRDFALSGKLGSDWDMELSHHTLAFNKEYWKGLAKSLTKFGKMTHLTYEVIRLEVDSFQLEFSPPRKEIFIDEKGSHHSNFTADFDFKLPYAEAILRRDFTINTLGVRFNSPEEIEFVDPLEGLKDLKDKVLRPVGQDFAKDSVRFLRALRFSLKLNFSLSSELKNLMKGMCVSGFTPAYLWSEMQKSKKPVSYLELLLNEKKLHPEMKLPLSETDLKKIPELRKILEDPTRHETWMIALEWVDIPCELWSDYFSLSSETGKKLARWAKNSKLFQTLLPENFQGEFEKVLDNEEFAKLFDWFFSTKQLLQKNQDLPLMKMIEEFLPEWIHLYRFEVPKDVKHIDPPLRAKYQVWNLCQRL